MDKIFDEHLKTNSQIMAKCEYNHKTGKVFYVNFRKYYKDGKV